MKLYCELCKKTQPVRIDNCRDIKTNEPYQDIVCDKCDFLIASGTDITQPEQEKLYTKQDMIDVIEAVAVALQPKWVGLTDEEIEECKINGGLPHAINWRLSVIKVMEAKLKEKNA